MPDFMRLTSENGHRMILVTAQVAAVIPPDVIRGDKMTTVFAGSAAFRVRESTDYVLAQLGVPDKRLVFDEREVPVGELADEELIGGWLQWAKRKSQAGLSQAILFEAELRRRGISIAAVTAEAKVRQ